MDAQIVGVSTDSTFVLDHWKKELNASYMLLSDHQRTVSEQYGVLIAAVGMSNRATFVIDKDGKIASIEEGNTAIDPNGAETACSRLAHKKAE
jgi:peroxiredoxin